MAARKSSCDALSLPLHTYSISNPFIVSIHTAFGNGVCSFFILNSFKFGMSGFKTMQI